MAGGKAMVSFYVTKRLEVKPFPINFYLVDEIEPMPGT